MQKFKKIFRIIILTNILFIAGFIGNLPTQVNATQGYTNEQTAIREVANAYYNKGNKAQYCTYRKSYTATPEEATKQHTIYTVCSEYIFSVYYQGFGIRIPSSTNRILGYGKQYYNPNNIKTNDVIEYWEKSTDLNGNAVYKDNMGNIKNINPSTEAGSKNYASKILREYELKVGDIICYDGHAVLVYDIIYDEGGNPIDAIIREAWPKYERKTTKIEKGLSFEEVLNEKNNIYEGAFQERYLVNDYQSSTTRTRTSVSYAYKDAIHFAILRPLLTDNDGNYINKYYYASFKSDSSDPIGVTATNRELTDYTISSATLKRIQYSAIDIEKTVDVFNNSIVDLGDTLQYTISIMNRSQNTYERFYVIENISDFTDVVETGNGILNYGKITWDIKNLQANQKIELKYKVKVKSNNKLLGKEIISTGTVAEIPSGTIKNVIANNLKEEEKREISNKFKLMIESKNYSGKNLILKTYDNALGKYVNLDSLDITDLVKTRAGIQYYPEGGASIPTIYMNKENNFSRMVLNNYFGGLYTDNSGKATLKSWEDYVWASLNGRCKRADTIYKQNFQTGDILIYKNTQTAKSGSLYQTENGTYYLIYIEEKDKIVVGNNILYGFIGIDENKNIRQISADFQNLQTLLGKDYYVVLRPAIIDIKSNKYEVIADNNKNYLRKINPETKFSEIISSLGNVEQYKITRKGIEIYSNSNQINDKNVATGDVLTFNNQIYTIVVTGDLNNNGTVDIGDVLTILKHIAAYSTNKHANWILTEEKLFAADLIKDGKLANNDILAYLRYIAAKRNQKSPPKYRKNLSVAHPEWLTYVEE